jgi:hypothetical protein
MNLPTVQKWASWVPQTILVFAVAVCFAGLAPAAFAQRGGGGHGGGHASSGHISGGASVATTSSGRVSGGSAGRASGGSAARSSGGSGRVISASGSANRGYTRSTFVAGPSRGGNGASTFESEGRASGGDGSGRTFAANNYFWEAPPQQARTPVAAPRPVAPMPMARPAFTPPMQSPRPMGAFAHPGTAPGAWLPGMVIRQPMTSRGFDRVSPPLASRPVTGSLPRNSSSSPFIGMAQAFPPGFTPGFSPFSPAFHHPIGGCFSAINCGFGFGFGFPFFNPFFPQFGFGFASPCFAGGFVGPCGFGGIFSLDWGLGYGNGWYYPPAEEPPPPPENPTEENVPPDYAPDYYFVPPPGEVEAAPAETKPVVKLELTDGTIFDVYSYWAQDGRLFYVTTYNIKTSIPLSDLDLQKTVDLNAKLGVTFSLSNKPPDQRQPPDGSGQ